MLRKASHSEKRIITGWQCRNYYSISVGFRAGVIKTCTLRSLPNKWPIIHIATVVAFHHGIVSIRQIITRYSMCFCASEFRDSVRENETGKKLLFYRRKGRLWSRAKVTKIITFFARLLGSLGCFDTPWPWMRIEKDISSTYFEIIIG